MLEEASGLGGRVSIDAGYRRLRGEIAGTDTDAESKGSVDPSWCVLVAGRWLLAVVVVVDGGADVGLARGWCVFLSLIHI